jgi:transposase
VGGGVARADLGSRGAAGLGHLLAQQLAAAGERVLDVHPRLASRVRLLQAGDTNKNDPNDALSVAVAALRSSACREVIADDYPAVLKVWSKRHRDLARSRNQVACRLHAVLCDLVPGGHPKEISAAQATRILAQVTPSGAVELAAEFPADLRHLDDQLRQTRKKPAAAVKASGTSLTQVFGAGPVIAGTVIGDVARFPGRDHFASYNGTAPVEVSSGNRKIRRLSLRGNRRINHAIHMAAITQLRHKHSEGRACYDKKVAEGKTRKDALRSLKRKISDAIFAVSRPTTAGPQRPEPAAREGNRGTTPARPAHTPNASSSDQPLPDLTPPRGPLPPQARLHHGNQSRRKPGQPLDIDSKEDSLCMFLIAGCWVPIAAQIRMFRRTTALPARSSSFACEDVVGLNTFAPVCMQLAVSEIDNSASRSRRPDTPNPKHGSVKTAAAKATAYHAYRPYLLAVASAAAAIDRFE